LSFSDTDTFGGGAGGCLKSVLLSALGTATGTAILFADSQFGYAMIAFVVSFLVAMPVIGLSALALGLPLTRLLESSGWERPWSYPLAGFILGGVIIFIGAEAVGMPIRWSEQSTPALLTGALPGLLCGALWWWFERRHRQGGHSGE
jgi:hypothetical protein